VLTIEQADDGDWELRKDGYIKAKSPDPRHVLIQFQHYLERTGDIRLSGHHPKSTIRDEG
jgi:hypothetical protein